LEGSILSSLRAALNVLKDELIEFHKPLSEKYEIPSVMKEYDGKNPILFKNSKEHNTPIIAGICGKREFFKRFLSCQSDEELYVKINAAVNNPLKTDKQDDAPVKEVFEKPDLTKFPILTHYERDAGPYITSAVVISRSLTKGFQNASIHRLLVIGKDRLAIRVVPRHLYALYNEAKKLRKPLPVAIAIGLHPLILLAASSGPRFGVDELTVANALLNGALKVTSCENIGVYVPAEAEVVFEGYMLHDVEVDEGPFVDITGTYDVIRKQPVIELINVMRRKDFIYQALLPAGSEHQLLMGLPKEARIWDHVSKVVSKVVKVRLTPGGCGWLHAAISIAKQSEGDGKNAILAAFAAHPSLKHVVVVDEDIDVDNIEEVEWAIATRFQGEEDLVIVKGCRGSSLDPSADQERLLTSKVGFDATKPLNKPAEKFKRALIPCKYDAKSGDVVYYVSDEG